MQAGQPGLVDPANSAVQDPKNSLRKWVSQVAEIRAAEIQVVLYTRQGCHLCDDVRAVLEAHGLAPHAIDIDCDAASLAKYDTCVPVVVMDGVERFRGRVNEVLLRRLLSARQ